MKLRTLLGDEPVLVITRVHGITDVDFMIIDPQAEKGQRVKSSGFMPLDYVLKEFERIRNSPRI